MQRKKASDFPQEVLSLFNGFIHYASNDERIDAMWPDDEAAAKLAGSRALDFFKKHLSA